LIQIFVVLLFLLFLSLYFLLKFSVHALSLFFSSSCQLFVFPPFNSFFHFFWSFYLHNIHENKRMKEIVFTNDRPKNVYLLSFRKLTSSRVTGRVPWCVTQSRIHWVTSLASHRSSTIDQNILWAAFCTKVFCAAFICLQESYSSTFYAQIFHAKVLWAAFL